MFKKFFIAIVAVIGICAGARGAILPIDSYTISRDKLPETAREMLDEHFPKAKVSMIKVDRHLLKKTDYDVKLTNGTRIKFDNKGKWKSVDCGKREVPSALIHKTVSRHVTKNYASAKIVSVTKKLSGYTIGLSDSRCLSYDLLGIFKGEVSPEEEE